MNIVIANSNPISQSLFEKLNSEHKTYFITSKKELTIDFLLKVRPDYIFFPHWSFVIKEEIWKKFRCVVFHMTDLPFGRGGSPLQNLIIGGYEETMISALKVDEEIDAGDIYLKRGLTLLGSAEEVYLRAGEIVREMIREIIQVQPEPIPQIGKVTMFERRRPEQSNLRNVKGVRQMFDHIRMLDAEGYPHAFIENEFFKFEFTGASLNGEQSVIANVRISKK
ncbi:MAG: hypothetical protein ABJP45_02660 [Cyclobacteriaceae bacterium]